MDFSSEHHRWHFSRIGGFDQVCLDSIADVLALDQLDQKLWATLSCPVQGLEFDSKLLEYIDTDKDGRIRVPEILEAVKWASSILKNPEDLLKCEKKLPLSAINDSLPEGKQTLGSAKQILQNLGKGENDHISVDDTTDSIKIFSKTKFNGDGIITPQSADSDPIKRLIEDIITCCGSELDRSGLPGINEEKVKNFFKNAQEYSDWWSLAESDATGQMLFVADNHQAAKIYQALHDKIDDFFIRCKFAAYQTDHIQYLNPCLEDIRTLLAKPLCGVSEGICSLPLAKIETNKSLPLLEGINPAWNDLVLEFYHKIVQPIFGEKTEITNNEWIIIKKKFTEYDNWLKGKKGEIVEKLGIQRIRDILSNNDQEQVLELIQKDKALESEANTISSVDKIVRLYSSLYRLLNNFVSFYDFYSPDYQAIFQAGRLYIDRRSCDLCIRVNDIAKHSAVASHSRTYLVYCDCVRKGGTEKMSIAAAVTQGDADNLMVGRNGIFYDRNGRDWDATITKIIEHPISIQQAFWSPYKRIGRMVSEQIEKFAAARDKKVDTAATAITDIEKKIEAPKPAPPAPVDVGKFAGIFAAIGLALGAIGTAIASFVTGIMALKWWEIPIAIAGLLLVISGPSMVMTYLNLRKRNLAPLLDANGWAINTQASINIPFGSSLTQIAKLPEGCKRTLVDPFAEKQTPWMRYLILILILAILLFIWQQGGLG